MILIACVLAAGAVPGIANGAPGAGPGGVDTGASAAAPATFERAANNTTTRHVNPDAAGEAGDLDGVREQLARRLAERLANSSVQLSEGEYEAAREAVDAQYRRDLGQYADVAGGADAGSGDRPGERLAEARERQREFASTVEEYRETYDAYQRAKGNGNETGARRLARRLGRLAARTNETGQDLRRNYRRVSNTTGVNLTGAAREVRNTTEGITARQAAVVEETFVETALTARAESARISFLDPLAAAGRVTALDGIPVGNGTVRIVAAGRTVRTTTNATGHFTLRYRPTLLPLNATHVTLRYVPGNASAYLGAEARVAVDVAQVRPSVELAWVSDGAGFGENVTATGTLAADGIPVAEAPVVLTVGGRRLGRAEVGGGGFTVTGRLPADIPAGERRARVSIPLEGRALAPATANGSVPVAETGTALTIDGAGSDSRTVRVTGRLTTADGAPVAGRPIRILANGSVVATVRTNSTGRYGTAVTVPQSVVSGGDGNTTVAVTAAFGGEGTNLASSRARADVTLIGPGGTGGVFGVGVSAWGWLGFGGLLSALAAAVIAVQRRGPRSGKTPIRTADGREADATGGGSAAGRGDDAPEALLALARRRADAGEHDGAVRVGYEALRRELAGAVDLAPRSPGTHWEFYRACRDAGLGGVRLDALRRVTEQYERAAFAAGSVPADRARNVIEDVQGLLGAEPPGDGEPAAADD